jgi:hypothetical protein
MVCAGSLHQSVIKTTSILAPLLGFVVERLLGNNFVILRLAKSLMFLPLFVFQFHLYFCLEQLCSFLQILYFNSAADLFQSTLCYTATVVARARHFVYWFNPLNAELNPICYLLALLGAHLIFHVSRIRVKRKLTS